MPAVCIDPWKPAMLAHRTDFGAGVGIANQGEPRERTSASRQSMIFGPNEAVIDDGFASLAKLPSWRYEL